MSCVYGSQRIIWGGCFFPSIIWFPDIWTQIIRLGGKHLFLLSHLACLPIPNLCPPPIWYFFQIVLCGQGFPESYSLCSWRFLWTSDPFASATLVDITFMQCWDLCQHALQIWFCLFLLFFLWDTVKPWLSWNSLYRSGWPWTSRCLPASTSASLILPDFFFYSSSPHPLINTDHM